VTESKRIGGLILVMMAAVTVSTAVAISVLYHTAFEQERAHLVQNVSDQAHLMEAVARLDKEHHGDRSRGMDDVILAKIQRAFDHYSSYGQIAEIIVARREGGNIVYVVAHGRVISEPIPPIPLSSGLAEPMRRALFGYSGSMIGVDYRGVTVLAAYRPVPILNAGVVAKIDLAAIRAPFLRSGLMVIGMALVLVTLGAVLFVRLTGPIVKHLSESKQRYQCIFRNVPVPIWEQDFSGVREALQDLRRSGVTELKAYLAANPDALRQLVAKVRIKEANEAALQLFGARSGVQFTTWFEKVLVPATLETSIDKLQALWQGRQARLSRTVTVQSLDNRDLTIILSVVVPRAGAEYRGVLVSALDVTADVKLRRREAELALIMASTGEGIFGMDSQGRCSFVNRAALQMLGYHEESELLGREMHSLIHHTCRDGTPLPREDCPIYRACCQDAMVCLEDEELWRADGTSFPAEFRSYPMLRDRAVVGTVVTFTDITERKERQYRHIHAQKMEVIGKLTGGIAHDFNNLLTIILANLRMLSERFEGRADEDTQELLEDALSAAEDGAAVTERLVDFCRRRAMEPRLADLNLLLGDLRGLAQRVIGDDIELILCRADEPLPVLVDPQQLENAVLNLAINARDAMPKGGKLILEATRRYVDVGQSVGYARLEPGAYAVVSVADTGKGMSAEVARRAVEPFYTTKAPGKGSGLGLSMVSRFADQAGGGLSIESAPGKGTTVSLFFPEADAMEDERDQVAETRRPPLAASGKITTILVVEDEQRTRRLARRALSELGFQVLEAENAAAAASLLEKDANVDLLFTDVVMPGVIDGRDLGYWARLCRPGLKVLLTSGFPQQEPEQQAPSGSTIPFLQKPYSKQQLQEAIQGLLYEQTSEAPRRPA